MQLGRGVKYLLTAEQLSELKEVFSKLISIVYGYSCDCKQKTQFNLSERNLKYIIPNQE
jgi:hypothetical protein